MKVRAVLAHKGLPYTKVPALTRVREIYRRGRIGKVPALDVDGEFLVDSTDIAHELERRFPTTPILPAAARERALCHALEDWSDESLYFFGLYYHWHEPAGRRQAAAYFARTWLGRLAFRPYLMRVERQLRGHGIGRKSPEHVRADLGRNLDAIEALLADRDFLLGDEPFLCDFAVAGQLAYLTRAATMKELLAAWPRTRRYVAALRERLG